VRPSRDATEARYRQIRLAALRRAQEIAAEKLAPAQVRLDLINASALRTFQDHWEPIPFRRYGWPWPKIVRDASRNEPDRFEAAVWSGDTLCGLAIGWTRQAFCRVDYLEGSPDPAHPLKGSAAVVVSGAVVAYAIVLDRREIRLINPLPAVVPHYEALGFTLASPKGGTPYCWRKVT
jgi:hypothetical protein